MITVTLTLAVSRRLERTTFDHNMKILMEKQWILGGRAFWNHSSFGNHSTQVFVKLCHAPRTRTSSWHGSLESSVSRCSACRHNFWDPSKSLLKQNRTRLDDVCGISVSGTEVLFACEQVQHILPVRFVVT